MTWPSCLVPSCCDDTVHCALCSCQLTDCQHWLLAQATLRVSWLLSPLLWTNHCRLCRRKIHKLRMVAEHWLLLQCYNCSDCREVDLRHGTTWAWKRTWRKQPAPTAREVFWQDGTLGRLELVCEIARSTVQDWSSGSDGECWDCCYSHHWWETWGTGSWESTILWHWLNSIWPSTTLLASPTDYWKCQTGSKRKSWTDWFSLPRTALDISLPTKVLKLRFRPDHFEQDYSGWETLKARYERQAGAPLPDNILVATLLNKTTGALQQHLRLNVRTTDTYETVRETINQDM